MAEFDPTAAHGSGQLSGHPGSHTGAHAFTGSDPAPAGGSSAMTRTTPAAATVTPAAVTSNTVTSNTVTSSTVTSNAVTSTTVATRRGGAEVVAPPHRHEQPADWGWHHHFGKEARIAGWASVVCLLLMITATQYNLAGTAALLICAALCTAGLLIDARRRHTAWRR